MGRVPTLSGRAEYERLYKWSLDKPADFWAHMAQQQGLYFKQKVCPLSFASELGSE